jgi:hypothetical protein
MPRRNRSLDVNHLSATGCLRPGWSGTCRWTGGHEIASISLRAEAERLHHSYRVRISDGKWEEVAVKLVKLVIVATHRLELFASSNNFFENLHYRQIRILPVEAF